MFIYVLQVLFGHLCRNEQDKGDPNPNPEIKVWMSEAHTNDFSQKGSTRLHAINIATPIVYPPLSTMDQPISNAHHQNISLIDHTHVGMNRH